MKPSLVKSYYQTEMCNALIVLLVNVANLPQIGVKVLKKTSYLFPLSYVTKERSRKRTDMSYVRHFLSPG